MKRHNWIRRFVCGFRCLGMHLRREINLLNERQTRIVCLKCSTVHHTR